MNRKDLVKAISDKTGLPGDAVFTVLGEMNDIILETLKKEEDVKISGFGVFTLSKRGPKKARNPKTGEKVEVPSKTSPRFKFSKSFKQSF